MARKEVHGSAAIEVLNRAIKKCFYPVITDKPFDLNKPKISWVANGEPIPAGFRMPLTPDEFDTLRKAVPELTDARLEAYLRRLYNLGDARAAAMTFQQVFEFCKDAIRAEKQDDTPPETEKPDTPHRQSKRHIKATAGPNVNQGRQPTKKFMRT